MERYLSWLNRSWLSMIKKKKRSSKLKAWQHNNKIAGVLKFFQERPLLSRSINNFQRGSLRPLSMGLDAPFVREEACFTVPTLYSLNRFETRTRLKGTRSSLKSSLIELNETGPTENASYEHFPEFDLRGKKRGGREKKALYSRTCKLARNWGKIGCSCFQFYFRVEFSFNLYSLLLR